MEMDLEVPRRGWSTELLRGHGESPYARIHCYFVGVVK